MYKNYLYEYEGKFGKQPPLIMEFPYENEDYQTLMLQAVETGKEITEDDIANYIKENNIEYGVVGNETKMGETDMEKEKIRKLLKKYGAPQDAIEDFMNDLYEAKEDMQEMGDMQQDENKGQDEYNDFAENNNLDENDNKLKEIAKDEEQHEDFLLNAQNVALLKATQEGKELLINAPTMAKDELEKAIKEYLLKNKGE